MKTVTDQVASAMPRVKLIEELRRSKSVMPMHAPHKPCYFTREAEDSICEVPRLIPLNVLADALFAGFLGFYPYLNQLESGMVV